MQKILFILNDSPYGGEKTFNGLRFAINLQEDHGKEVDIKLFCFSDSILTGLAGQNPNEGSNVQQLMDILIAQGAEVKLCTSCVKARGLLEAKLIDGVTLGTLADVSDWTLWADKVISF
ncbi:DsrE family protein [Aggregatibacter actinomycetemcomitans]|uniref:DsrE/DsrF/TusD sulfur relay family protein n=1 Tax=Aggregatibacter actinomycetemcomitans TaxID=714 RepID=UPI00197C6F71|nr:DsrE family protein [Aggregatibacter actinomycetemcomitans]MBN6067668.1 DsrE family protein [Aggregatibacter actinomycetemcomitans]MBN6085605.1 DsrE family protein [Aggregatibacter actinomycetemcomitans]